MASNRRVAVADARRERRELPGLDRGTRPRHELEIEMQVVVRREPGAEYLVALLEVAQVRARVVTARVARARGVERTQVRLEAAVAKLPVPASQEAKRATIERLRSVEMPPARRLLLRPRFISAVAAMLLIAVKSLGLDTLQQYFPYNVTLGAKDLIEVILLAMVMGVVLCGATSFVTLRRYLRA